MDFEPNDIYKYQQTLRSKYDRLKVRENCHIDKMLILKRKIEQFDLILEKQENRMIS